MILDFPHSHEIVPGVFVGNQFSANADFPGMIICVLERKPDVEPEGSIIMPILTPRVAQPAIVNTFERMRSVMLNAPEVNNKPLTDWEATLPQLDKIAEVIEYARDPNRGPVLVHCGGGIERSPLAVAWYLFRKCGMTFEEAYDLVKMKRPIAQDRRAWLSRSARALAFPSNAYDE